MNDTEYHQRLNLFLDKKSIPFISSLDVSKLLNKNFIETLFLSTYKKEKRWSKTSALSEVCDTLPTKAGIYMFVWSSAFMFKFDISPAPSFAFPVYIGSAGAKKNCNGTIKARYQSEYKKIVNSDPKLLWSQDATKSREKRLKAYLNLRPLEFWYIEMEDPTEIEEIERLLISIFNPPANEKLNTYRAYLRKDLTQPA